MANASTADSPGRCDSEGRDRQQSSSVWEIEEESELFEINHGRAAMASIKEEISLTDAGSMFSVDVNGSGEGAEECVYVGVGKGDSSLEAVAWAAAQSSSATVVYLIHVFPQVHHIPSPLGKLPKSQVSGEQVKKYMAEEGDKRRELLQRFINKCSATASISKVETVLIESDLVAKAMVDLIPILNIRKLVLGTNRSNVKKLKHRKGGNTNNNIAAQVLQSSPEWCEISVISQGKLVLNTTALQLGSSPSTTAAGSSSSSSSPSLPPPPPRMDSSSTGDQIINAAAMEELQQVITSSNHNDGDAFACMCFRSPKVAI
ncbi:unnamed protein product [Linum trigynum]|uniref:Uncharacterized protein n=1 Tax=Linum trigynum TaxID=586398 RepID=A0AAV2C817_9ROSI